MKKQDLYRQTIQRWGKEGQIDMFHEEVGELLSALNKYKRGRVPAKEVVTEIADVQIMTRMTCKHCGMEDICLLRSHHGPNGGITMSCNMFVRCRRNQNWDKEHQFQIATVEGDV